MLGKVGADTFGKLLLGTLQKAGIETKGMIVADDVFTTLAFVTLDEHGDREFSFARKPGADTQITFEELDFSLIDDTKVFHFGTLSLTEELCEEALRQIVSFACTAAGLSTTKPGGISSVPDLDTVLAKM